ncbi:DUF4129 domain-containing protein, partial [Streptosporangium sandarakinum]
PRPSAGARPRCARSPTGRGHTSPRACWLRLEHAAAGAGTPRLASDTPAELVARLLAGHRVGEPALNRLAAAYRLARYAPHEVTGPLRAEARAALAEVDAELTS